MRRHCILCGTHITDNESAYRNHADQRAHSSCITDQNERLKRMRDHAKYIKGGSSNPWRDKKRLEHGGH